MLINKIVSSVKGFFGSKKIEADASPEVFENSTEFMSNDTIPDRIWDESLGGIILRYKPETKSFRVLLLKYQQSRYL